MADILTETVLETQEVYRGRVIHLNVNTVRLPDGSISRREIVEHRGAVCIVPITDDGNILMVRQYRLAAGAALLEVPAGTLEVGEDPSACALRELEEETGWIADELIPLYEAFLAPGYSTERMYGFAARGIRKAENARKGDADEFIGVEAIPIAELEQKILNGELHDCKSLSAVLMALKKLGL
jgi:8-oxo-dGTP pyrophosphatase MutT (NUDIX family)